MMSVASQFFVAEGKFTPEVILNEKLSKLHFTGRCAIESTYDFFHNINEVVSTHFKTNQTLEINLCMEYLNTSSTKAMVNFLKETYKYTSTGKVVNVNWLYEQGDRDMMEVGEDISDLLELTLNLVEIPFETEYYSTTTSELLQITKDSISFG
ncbi:MAG: DUF1987 domain-containing protein [Cyclobacteriaceae bacterium]